MLVVIYESLANLTVIAAVLNWWMPMPHVSCMALLQAALVFALLGSTERKTELLRKNRD